MGPWSAGTKTIEASIQNAYVQMIDAAQHYIYIEVREESPTRWSRVVFLRINFSSPVLKIPRSVINWAMHSIDASNEHTSNELVSNMDRIESRLRLSVQIE